MNSDPGWNPRARVAGGAGLIASVFAACLSGVIALCAAKVLAQGSVPEGGARSDSGLGAR